ncbi:LacI family transcriptional regulator [Vagococcus lutrae]|uniref:LacI family DNA-binding transcriptional regulator n=1 Tax=Vagococcus lutrae TaxID=81947 RepID=UPI00200E1159|nr:LacI family DNA-binding transcriptional regulator [Vagococcus lutrae]UQF23157.1 LacI family transcriptional regulator [Vagococcus lutrae]UQF64759.1 LacI family transcriptional regulator [Vagococcus lutrae]
MSKKKRVTRSDVAKRAGVSETIVSYVVNNNRYVDKEKKKRVLAAIKELNYLPNYAARTLQGKKSNHIVFIADRIENEHFSGLVKEIEKHAYEHGYMISLCANRNTPDFVQQIISRQYDGIIISSISFKESCIQDFLDANIPVVLLHTREYKNISGVGLIGTGLYHGTKNSVRYLVDQGRKDIIYIDRYSKRGNFSSIEDLRYRGFVEEMSSLNQKIDETSIISGCHTQDEVVQKIQTYLAEGNRVDAICARNDNLACISMKAVQEMGFDVPKDIAIIGFDNSALSQFITPTLTTVAMEQSKIGQAAFDMLYGMIEEDEEPGRVEFAPQLIIRESV